MVIFVSCLQAMTKAFKVAGHVFHLEIPDGDDLAGMLSQYEPFATDPSDDPLFVAACVLAWGVILLLGAIFVTFLRCCSA